MLFSDEEAPQLKMWIVKRLENTSDADADVLADYVLALLRHDGDIATVRRLCEEEIPDFLKEDSAIFIKDLFDTVLYKTYLPAGARPAQAMASNATAVPTGPSAMQYNNLPGLGAPGAPMGPSNSKKRGFDDRGDAEALLGRIADDINGRGFKQPRMGSNAPGGQYDQHGGYNAASTQNAPPMPPMPQMPASMPQFDPNDPVAMMAAMQAMGFQIPGMPGFGSTGPPPATNGALQTSNRRCRDYDTKGFCARGNNCKFEHSDSMYIPQAQGGNDEYDPTSSSLLLGQNSTPASSFESRHQPPRDFNPNPYSGSNDRGGRGRGGGQFNNRGGPNGTRVGRGGRSEFSSDRPNYDRTKTKIVVENIPEDKFDEGSIREFFAQFGDITELKTQDYRRIAIITFDTYEHAQAAYSSPKVIFDNRFVKVFWYKDEESLPQPPANRPQHHFRHGSGDTTMTNKAPEIDMEEFAKKQAEAQAAHEEKEKKKAEVEKQREDMHKKAQELLAKQAEEKKKLMERLAAMEKKTPASADQPKSEAQLLREKMLALEAETKRLSEAKSQAEEQGHQPAWAPRGRGRGGYRGRGAYTPHVPEPHVPSPTTTTPTEGTSSDQAEALKQQLAALEAEAQQLGIDPTSQEDQVGAWPTRGRGRGGFRGRGTFPPRGRGAFRGRGGAAFGSGATAYKLDNRPKTVAVSGADFSDSSKDEALRQFLLGVGEFASIEQKGGKTEITFNDRFTAEKFMYGVPNNELPGVGKVEMAWIQKPLPPVTLPPPSASDNDTSSPTKDSEMDMGDSEKNDGGDHNMTSAPVEHDRERDLDYDDGDNDWAQ